MNGDPCYGCENRKIGCHSKCDRYICWKKSMKDLKELYLQMKKKDAIVDTYVKESNMRNIKKKHIK